MFLNFIVCCYEEFFFPIDIWVAGENRPPLESIKNLFITQEARRHTSVELLVKLFNKIMEALQRTSYAKEHELIKFEIKKGEVFKFTINCHEIRKVKRRKKIKKIPGIAPNTACNRPKSRKVSHVEITVQKEEKPFLKEEIFDEIPDDEIHHIPEKHYADIDKKVEKFSNLLRFVVEGEVLKGKYEKMQNREVFPTKAMEKQDDCVESQSYLKLDQSPMKNQEPAYQNGACLEKKYDDLREVIWKLNWLLSQVVD